MGAANVLPAPVISADCAANGTDIPTTAATANCMNFIRAPLLANCWEFKPNVDAAHVNNVTDWSNYRWSGLAKKMRDCPWAHLDLNTSSGWEGDASRLRGCRATPCRKRRYR